MTRIPARRGVRHAFTLLELLVVIGIIVILLGMLFPVIKKIQYATYSANTQQEISQLQNAINQYYATFHAYPGPFSNDQIENLSGGIALEVYTIVGGAPTYGAATTINNGTKGSIGTVNVTGTQNLLLGLLGGLRIDPTAPNDPAFAPGEVGLGPLTLTNANSTVYIPQRNPPFLNVSSGGSTSLLMWCGIAGTGGAAWRGPQPQTQYLANLTGFTDLAGNQALDAGIPVFVDRFPDPGPLPILYLRARTGVRGILSDGAVMTDPTPAATGVQVYQYDIRDISPYTGNSATDPQTVHIGLPTGSSHNLIPPTSAGFTFTVAANSTAPASVTGAGVNGMSDAGAYFYDPSIPPTNPTNQQTVDYTGRPRAVDSFILISAGPDGIYGTTDDITSFGTASH